MKKLLFMFIALLMSGAILAQGSKGKMTTKSFLAFHAGAAVPNGDFKKKTLNPDGFFGGGGFANTGYNLNLLYEYRLGNHIALAANGFFNNNKINTNAFVKEINKVYFEESGEIIDATGIKLDHWKWYGVAAGPVLIVDLKKNMEAGFLVMGGFATANSPKVSFEGTTIFAEDWSPAAVFRGGADLRVGVGKNVVVFANADYMYLKPEFKKEFTDPFFETTTIERGYQKFSVFNLTGGIGIKF